MGEHTGQIDRGKLEKSECFRNFRPGAALRNSFFGVKRVHFLDSLLIPQNELNIARASIPEFAGKREEDPVRFLLQAEAILQETGIHVARWVTVWAPQLKTQARTWWGTTRALDLPWQ
ncbi:hypothetical protein QTP88_021580 [Uroleucon formosanum]